MTFCFKGLIEIVYCYSFSGNGLFSDFLTELLSMLLQINVGSLQNFVTVFNFLPLSGNSCCENSLLVSLEFL